MAFPPGSTSAAEAVPPLAALMEFDFLEVADRLPEPLLLLGANGEVRAANRRALGLMGQPRDAIVGRRLWELIGAAEEPVAAFLRLCARSGHPVPGNLKIGEQTDHVWPRCEAMLIRPASAGSPALLMIRWPLAHRLSRSFVELNARISQLSREVRLRRALEEKLKEVNAELARTNAELARLARTDALTGVANRRYFEQLLGEELRRAVRSGAPVSLLMIDVDFFKAYNDGLGHPAGDNCLIQVAHTIGRGLRRAGDCVARYGGEEFTVLLPDTALSGARQRADTIRRELARLAIAHPASPVDACVTVSIGVATVLPGDGGVSAAALIEAADHALYRAKREGRNRVCTTELNRRGAPRRLRRQTS